jgi:hypothetical protein
MGVKQVLGVYVIKFYKLNQQTDYVARPLVCSLQLTCFRHYQRVRTFIQRSIHSLIQLCIYNV